MNPPVLQRVLLSSSAEGFVLDHDLGRFFPVWAPFFQQMAGGFSIQQRMSTSTVQKLDTGFWLTTKIKESAGPLD